MGVRECVFSCFVMNDVTDVRFQIMMWVLDIEMPLIESKMPLIESIFAQ